MPTQTISEGYTQGNPIHILGAGAKDATLLLL